MAFHVKISPDMEELTRALGDQLRDDLREGTLDLFRPASIIVPHANLARWATLRLASHLGIAANLDFPYLESALWQALTEYRTEDTSPLRLDAVTLQRLINSLFAARSSLRDDPVMRPMWAYIEGGSDLPEEWPPDVQRRAWQLADRLARLFLEYECQRPDMITAWNAGLLLEDITLDRPMQGWQQRLFRELFQAGGWRDQTLSQYRTLPQFRAMVRIAPGNAARRPLYLLGLSHTSPFHLDLLRSLAQYRKVFAYLCLPPSAPAPAHPLLTAWGKSAQQMLDMLENRKVTVSVSQSPCGSSSGMLAAARDSVCGGSPAAGTGQDRSLQVWACPGQHREVETVYQMILGQLGADATLRLTDVAVLVTDMDAYLPALHEVFGRQGSRIPYNLVDASAARLSQYGAAVIALLGLVGSPFTRRDVFALLMNPCCLAAMGADMSMARQWLTWATALGIFHSYRRDEKCQACDTGADEQCRACRDDAGHFDPDRLSDAHTWLAGLRRLRLGRIMTAPPAPADDGVVRAWTGAIPYDDLETRDLEMLETFTYGVEALYRACAALTTGESRRSCRAWRDAVRTLLDATLAIPEAMPQERMIRTILHDALEAFAALEPCYPDGVTLGLVREYLLASQADIPANYGRPLLDGITITSLRQGRLLPFRQIYVIGLGEGSFPGSPEMSTLDLRRGGGGEADLAIPDVNRQLMLDTLLAARDRLVLTYNCRDLAEDAELNPCSIITQLEGYLEGHLLPRGTRFTEAPAPLTGRSEQYLYQADAACPRDALVNFDVQDRVMALAGLNVQEVGLSQEMAENREGILDSYLHGIAAHITLPPVDVADSTPLAISIRSLGDFLVNPAEARLKRQLFLADVDVDETAEQEIEPFTSTFPTTLRLSSAVQERYIRQAIRQGGVAVDPAGFFKADYADAHRRSLTPDGVFARLDAEHWEQAFLGAVSGDDGLGALLTRLCVCPCHSVSIGSVHHGDAPMIFPATSVSGFSRQVTISGALAPVWMTGNALETVLVTTSKAPEKLAPDAKTGRWQLVKHILPPLLAYVAMQAGTEPGPMGCPAAQWVGSRPFIIHVSATDGIQSASFFVAPDEARAYLQALAADYLAQRVLDDLPLSAICRSEDLWPLTGDNADGYTERVQAAIDESLEDSYRVDRSRMALLELIPDIRVPDNAYDLVERRLMPLYHWRVTGGDG